jgi:phosphatidylserine/phosphatidylglycerophosphate/cardiolipin synthase-like enzyme
VANTRVQTSIDPKKELDYQVEFAPVMDAAANRVSDYAWESETLEEVLKPPRKAFWSRRQVRNA